MTAAPAPASAGLTLLLGLVIGLAALGMDLFLPAVPAIARAFDASPGAAQFCVTTYLLGLAGGQLLWGPVSDRYGRKPALLAGLALFLAASLAAATAQSLAAVAALRCAQGIAMSSGSVIARSVVRDLYAREHAAQLLGRMTVVFGLVPIFAPLAGAQALAWGWQAVFWLYAAIAAALLAAVALALSETAPPERAPIAPGRVAASFARLLGDRRFVAPLATLLCALVGIVAFVSNSSLVMVQALGLSPAGFSFAFAAIMVGHLAGGFACSRLVHRLGMAGLLRAGAALALAAGGTLAALAFAGVTHWSAIVAPMLAYVIALAFIVPNATAAALTPFPAMAGAASSLLGVLPFALGALASAALGAAFDGSARPMAAAVALAGAGAFAAERLLYARLPRGAVHG